MYLDIPGSNVTLFVVVNPPNYNIPSPSKMGAVDPESGPLDPSKHSLVLLHAGAFSSAGFTPQFSDARLAGSYNLIAFDARMHGRTTGKDTERLSIREIADHFITALDILGIKKYSIVGQGTLGSNCATVMALLRRDAVESIVLVSPGALVLERDGPVVALERKTAWMEAAFVNKDGSGDGSGRIPDDSVAVIMDLLFGSETRVEALRSMWLEAFQARYGVGQSSHDIRCIVECFLGRHSQGITLEERASLTTPILILQGADAEKTAGSSQESSLEFGKAWRDAFTGVPGGAEFQIITGAPPLILITDFSVANRTIKAFVERHRPDPSNSRPSSFYMPSRS